MSHSCVIHAGWRRPIGCFKLQVIFAKEPLICKALLSKIHRNYASLISCVNNASFIHMNEWRVVHTYEWCMNNASFIRHSYVCRHMSHVSIRIMCQYVSGINDVSCMDDAWFIRHMDDASFTSFIVKIAFIIYMYAWWFICMNEWRVVHTCERRMKVTSLPWETSHVLGVMWLIDVTWLTSCALNMYYDYYEYALWLWIFTMM